MINPRLYAAASLAIELLEHGSPDSDAVRESMANVVGALGGQAILVQAGMPPHLVLNYIALLMARALCDPPPMAFKLPL